MNPETSCIEIDHNFSKAHRVITTSIIPVVEKYAEHSKEVWEGSKVDFLSALSGRNFSRRRPMFPTRNLRKAKRLQNKLPRRLPPPLSTTHHLSLRITPNTWSKPPYSTEIMMTPPYHQLSLTAKLLLEHRPSQETRQQLHPTTRPTRS